MHCIYKIHIKKIKYNKKLNQITSLPVLFNFENKNLHILRVHMRIICNDTLWWLKMISPATLWKKKEKKRKEGI